MADFQITVDPPLPVGPIWLPEDTIPLGKIFWQLNDVSHKLFTLRYLIESKTLQYYPSNLGTIVSDLYREYDISVKSEAHGVEFSGYTVAIVDFIENNAIFRDAGPDFGLNGVFGVVSTSEYLMKLRQAIGSALHYIRGLELD